MKFSRTKANQGFISPWVIPFAIFIIFSCVVLDIAALLARKHYITPSTALLAVPLFWIAVWTTTSMVWRPRKNKGLGPPVAKDTPPLETQILDAAFKLVKQSTAATEAKDKLQQMFPTVPFTQITDSYLRACALGDACYDAADQCRDKRLTDKQAVELLRQQFPGFSPKSYSHALTWGYFLSR